MSNVPADLRYTKDHEWIRLAADGTATIGITDHAQAALGDVTFVDLPKAGKSFAAGDVFGAVESVPEEKTWNITKWDEKEGPLARTDEGLNLPLADLVVLKRQPIEICEQDCERSTIQSRR